MYDLDNLSVFLKIWDSKMIFTNLFFNKMRKMFVEWTIGFKTERIITTPIKNKHVKNLDGGFRINNSEVGPRNLDCEKLRQVWGGVDYRACTVAPEPFIPLQKPLGHSCPGCSQWDGRGWGGHPQGLVTWEAALHRRRDHSCLGPRLITPARWYVKSYRIFNWLLWYHRNTKNHKS